jgi:hypothetical protein
MFSVAFEEYKSIQVVLMVLLSLLLLFLPSRERATDFAPVSLPKELCKPGFQ